MKHFLLGYCFILAMVAGEHPDTQVTLSSTDQPKQFITSGLFETDSILNIRLEGEVKKLVNDRGDNAAMHALKLTYTSADQSPYTIDINAKTRGNFRRKLGNCAFPPIMLHFKKDDLTKQSLFHDQKKLKLVLPCRNEELVIKEWLAYKIYNLITPKSFRTRLVKITWVDTKKKKDNDVVYGMILEDEDDLAARNQSYSVEKMHLSPTVTDSTSFFNMAIFQLLIGNTDWSVQYMQNIKFLSNDTLNIRRPETVPYDFDMSGWVSAPYAKPAEELMLNSVRTRRFRGYCVPDAGIYDNTLQQFEKLKPEIYKLVKECALLSPKTIASEIDFLDGFYSLLNNKEKLKKELLYPCDKNGTGNVVLTGLQNEQKE